MDKVMIDNGFFLREADPENAADMELLSKAAPGQSVIREELSEAEKERIGLYMEEMDKASSIISRPKAYDPEFFNRYVSVVSTLFVLTRWKLIRPVGHVDEELTPMIRALKELREKLVPLRDPEEDIWYIWGNDMPNRSLAAKADWRLAFDGPDYRPFLIPYMLDDQSAVKGNVIVVSGGAYEWRSNRWEGYEAVGRFNELGYNTFLLQRRIAPYDRLDGAMDLQRSVRWLKANAQKLGIGAMDRIAVNGYSGGGWCICDMLADCYADKKPDAVYPDYICDGIDAQDSRVDAAIIIYGAAGDEERVSKIKANPDLPPVFMAVGQDDFVMMDESSAKLYLELRSLVPVELHIFAATGHGFGVGPAEDVSFADRPVEGIYTNVAVWPEMADEFMQLRFGLKKAFRPNGQ